MSVNDLSLHGQRPGTPRLLSLEIPHPGLDPTLTNSNNTHKTFFPKGVPSHKVHGRWTTPFPIPPTLYLTSRNIKESSKNSVLKKELKFNQRFAFMGINLACRKMTDICGRTKIFKVSGHLNSGTKLLLFWPATFYSITTIRTLL